MKQKLLLALLALFTLGGSNLQAQTEWEDKTSLITNPSFETDEAVQNATNNALNSASVTGWTILPTTTVSNAQAAVVNSSSTLSVLSGSDGATTGSKYFYVRQNWNATGNFGATQTISNNVPAGLYLLTCKIKTSSSTPGSSKWYLSIQEGEKDAVLNSNAGSAAEWLNYGVVIYKESDETSLTISAYMVAGASGGSQHYAMLLDDFQLKYISPINLGAVTEEAALNMTNAIYNEGIYNANKEAIPRGWQEYGRSGGNNNRTEGTNNTQLEGWAGNNDSFSRDYYQTINNLPEGKYTVTAKCHDTNEKGAYLYIYSAGARQSINMPKEYANITTPALSVTNGSINIGIKIENKQGTWMTGDDFQLTYLGIQPMYDETKARAVETRDNNDYANIHGKEKTKLLEAIALTPSTYEDYKTAINSLNEATESFKAAKDSYDQLATAIANAKTNGVNTDEAEAIFNSEETTAEIAVNTANNLTSLTNNTIAVKDASADNGIPTEFVVNGDFAENTNGWYSTGEFPNIGTATNQLGDFTDKFWENWNGTAKENKMYQTINNIPNGTYKLKIAAFVNILDDPNDSQFVFANENKTYLTTTDPTYYEVWTVVTNNTLEIGLEQTTATANWMGIDNVSLTYYGAGDVIEEARFGTHKKAWQEALAAAQEAVNNEDYANVIGAEFATLNTEINKAEPTTAEGYDEAAAALLTATDAFIAAKPNYDALIAEIAKAKALGMDESTVNGYAATTETTAATALTNTQNLKVAEYNYVTETYQYGVELGEWTSTATGTKAATFNNEHWSGTTHEYKNQDDSNGQGWNANSWSINFSQNVTLPAGNYVFKVAGRQAAGDKVNTSLVVKVGETELGSVSDFPRGNSARGINKNGETSFNESDDAYANSGKGFGWEWRYVKFTLDEDATVNIAINSEATANQQWVSFGDYTVQTDNEANISLIAYNIALNNANTTIANTEYANITGKEKTALETAIAADNKLDKTNKEAIEAATTTLTEATTAFTAAKAAYDAFVAAKTAETPELVYALASKKDALTTAKATADATSAADAETKTAAITKALRVYYESHALAEGVDGATNCTEKVKNNLFNDNDNDWTSSQSGGNKQVINTESFTDGDGNNNYNYYDYYNNDANNQNVSQTIEGLEPGIYILTVTARAATSLTDVRLYAGSAQIEIPRKGNSGQTFDRGWNDVTLRFVKTNSDPITIKVASNPSGGNHGGWFGFTRVRLVKLPADEVTLRDAATENPAASDFANVTYNRTLTAGFNSLVLPFDVTKEEIGGEKVKEIYSYNGCTVTGEGENVVYHLDFQKVVETLKANTPYLVNMAEAVNLTSFNGKEIKPVAEPKVEKDYFSFVGSYVALEKDNDVVKAGDYGCTTSGLKKAKNGIAMKAFRAYMKNTTGNTEAKVNIMIDGQDTDAITAVEIFETMTEGIYNLQGQKVNHAQKGIFILNGKKVVVK